MFCRFLIESSAPRHVCAVKICGAPALHHRSNLQLVRPCMYNIPVEVQVQLVHGLDFPWASGSNLYNIALSPFSGVPPIVVLVQITQVPQVPLGLFNFMNLQLLT